jgi:hypothetical protein
VKNISFPAGDLEAAGLIKPAAFKMAGHRAVALLAAVAF